MINRAMLYSKFIRYDELHKMLIEMPSIKKDLKFRECNIYIDIQSIYRDVLTSEFLSEDNKTIGINILNLAAHYRHFFRNELESNVTIYLINSQVIDNYNLCMMQNANNETAIFNMVEVLSKYIPNIYYIHRKNVNACSIIYSLIANNPSDNGHLVISNDVYANQLTALFNKTSLLRLGKHKYFVTNNTAIYACFKNTTPTSDLSPNLIPIIMAFNKCKDLNLPLIYPYKTAIKKVREAIAGNAIYQGYNAILPSIDGNKYFFDGFYDRWKICDLVQIAQSYINSPDILDTTWQTKRQCDFYELANIIDEKINSFPDNVLNYIFLLE